MTIFELLWFGLRFGGGGALGYCVGQVPGMIAGVIAGAGAMWSFARVLDPHPGDWPACQCGAKEISSFSVQMHPTHSIVYRCSKCDATYLMRKGNRWSRVLADGTTELSMNRAWPGRWTPVQVAPPDTEGSS